MKTTLIVAAVAEALTGLSLMLAPSMVGGLLLGQQRTGDAIPLAQVAGIALVGLGFACWPGPPRVGMLIYSGLVALYFAYLGAADGYGGILLWPAVILLLVLIAPLARGPSEGTAEPVGQ
jgi:hypothetical protein